MSEALKLVPMRDSHYGMVAKTLRAIADEVDSGKFHDVQCAAIVFRSETGNGETVISVFGSGEESTPQDTFMALHAGAVELLRINGMVKS